jgi:hypothetical protein
MVDDERTSRERMEQFYKLLAEYGLTGKSQPLSRRQQDDLNAMFEDEHE